MCLHGEIVLPIVSTYMCALSVDTWFKKKQYVFMFPQNKSAGKAWVKNFLTCTTYGVNITIVQINTLLRLWKPVYSMTFNTPLYCCPKRKPTSPQCSSWSVQTVHKRQCVDLCGRSSMNSWSQSSPGNLTVALCPIVCYLWPRYTDSLQQCVKLRLSRLTDYSKTLYNMSHKISIKIFVLGFHLDIL